MGWFGFTKPKMQQQHQEEADSVSGITQQIDLIGLDADQDAHRLASTSAASKDGDCGIDDDGVVVAPPTGVELQKKIFSCNKRHELGGLCWTDEEELKRQRR